MNKFLATLLTSGLLLSSSVCATNTVIPIQEMTNELMADFWAGDFLAIVEIPEGTTVPLNLVISGDLIVLEQTNTAPPYLRAVKTFYVKRDRSEIRFSTDLLTWRTLSEFVTGMFQAVLSVQDQGPEAVISLEINERQ